MSNLTVGQRVYVLDQGLAELRSIMLRATGSQPKPNHRGTIAELWDEGQTVLIDFDDGAAAPYPVAQVRPLEGDLDTRGSG